MFIMQGLAIGNGFIDPASMMDYSSFVYQAGLVDSKVASRMKVFELSCDAALAANDWELAFKVGSHIHIINKYNKALVSPDYAISDNRGFK